MLQQILPVSLSLPGMTRRLSRFAAALSVTALCGSSLAIAQAPPAPATPIVSPLGGVHAQPQQITLTDSTPGAVLYYIINGGTPILYSAPFLVSTSETVQAAAVSYGGGTHTVGPYNTQSYTIQAGGGPGGMGPGGSGPAWTELKVLPSLFSTQGGSMVNVGDGNIYAFTTAGTPPNRVNSVFVASQKNLAKWINITSSSLSQNGTEGAYSMGMSPNGTVFLSEGGSGVADVFHWNGSTTAPAWTKVTGYNGVSPSVIYNFTNDSAGYTYFSPAWSGNIWRNDAPNSTNFTNVYTNLYSLIGTGLSGGLYQTRIFDLGDGKGDMLWTCGEGVLMNVDLAFKKVTEYLNTSGYSGNCTGLGKSATNILALRTADGNGDQLSQISIATRKTTIVPSTNPIASPHYPSYMNTNLVGGLQWVYGTKWMLNNTAHQVDYLLLSQDDGTTWTDITKSGAIDSSCTAGNLGLGATVFGQYILTRCQGGKVFWMYGPV
jgi:Chitobiase/beta-hexosaminidase C-terminal domain